MIRIATEEEQGSWLALIYAGSYREPMTHEQARTLADAVVADGFAAHHEGVSRLVAAVAGHRVTPVLVDVVADPSAPTAARYRALGRILVEYCRDDPAVRGARSDGCDVLLPEGAPRPLVASR